MKNGYIARQVVKETENAYLVEQTVDNKRDGRKLNYRWVAKSICLPIEGKEYEDLKKFGMYFVDVPESAVSNGVW